MGILSLALAAVFVVAAVGKLADLRGSRAAVEGFGVPRRPAAILGTALPFAELAIAAALVVPSAARVGAIAALVLLATFIAGVARAMMRGEAIQCHCFGALHSAPVGWRTLARNAGLALLALALVTGGAAFAALAAAIAVGTAAAHLVLRRRARRPRSAPTFTVEDLDGGRATLESLRVEGRPLLLVFTASNCGPCHALLPQVRRWQSEFADELAIAVIASGDTAANRATAEEHGLDSMFVQDGTRVSSAYGVTATPSAVLVNADGTITRPPAPGEDAIRALLPGAPDPRPQELVTIDGDVVDLTGGRQRVLLVFWNAGCGFCKQIEDELVEWSATRRRADPRFVVVSRGDTDALPFDAPIVADPDGALMSAFGAPGTPSAVLIERDGSIVTPVAVGGPDTLDLMTDGLERRELIRTAGAFAAMASLLAPATALGAGHKHCPPGRKLCGSRCCPKGFSCKTRRVRRKSVKQCVCPKPRRICGKSCVDTASDPKHCGACSKVCAAGQSCQAGKCVAGQSEQPQQQPAPTCGDGIRNGTETDIDCGGPTCPKCADGKGCSTGSDCVSGVCTGGVCSQPAATCSDGKKNGGETDADCGGPQCPACANGKTCVVGTDCASGHCLDGVCRDCAAASDCPQGPVGDCHRAVCSSGVCGFAVDDTDLPSGANECQQATCTNGVPALAAKAAGAPCSQGGTVCDGNGTCAACVQPSDCPPGPAGDCKKAVCNSNGTCGFANDDSDVPVPSNDCENATCVNGTAQTLPKTFGSACASNGGVVCDGLGTCVACNTPSDCPGVDTSCKTRTCVANTCGTANAPAGTPCLGGGTCDGAGGGCS